jgi:PAS domain S-box-containing protein
MDGIAFLKTVRERFGDMPFILFTGRGREEVVIEAINHGADFYIQKGGDPMAQFAELSYKIRQAVRRKQAERSLLESEQRFSDIINFLPDATFAIDRSGQVISWNRAIEELTGVPAGEMLGKGDYAYAVPFYGSRRRMLINLINEPDEKLAKYHPAISRSGNSLTAECDLSLPQGRRILVLAKAGPLYNPYAEIIGAIESMRDITDRKRDESALQQVSLELRLIFKNMINAFVVWESVFDEQGKYVSFHFGQFNDAYARIANVKYEDVHGRDIFEVWPTTEMSWVEVYGSVATTGIPRVFDMYHEPTKGWYHCNAYRPTDSPAKICVFFEDINERRQAETELRAAYEQLTAAEEELREQFDELTLSEQRTRESEAKYRDLVESANSIILKWDKNGTITFFNEFAQRFFGYSPEEIIGRSVMDTIVPSTESGSNRDLRCMIDEIIAQPGDHLFNENENVTREGKRVWIRWQNKILQDEKGRFDGLFSIGTDITERKQAERALLDSEKRYRDLFELNNAVMLIINPENGGIVDVNSAASRYYGYSHEEFSRMAITALNIADPAITRQNLARAVEKNGAVFSLRHRKKDGEVRDVDVFSAPITLGGQRLLHSIIQDVTGRRWAEEALRKNEEKYRTLFENMLEGFAYCRMIYDEGGRPADWVYLDVNAAFERLTGLKNITGKWVLEAIPDIGALNPELIETYGRVASTGTSEIFEINFVPLKMWMKVSVFSPERGYFVAVFDDMTTRKAAEISLQAKTEELDRFFSVTLDLLCIADMDGYFHKLNKSWQTTLEYSEEELMSHRFLDFVHPDDLESTLASIAALKGQSEVLNLSTGTGAMTALTAGLSGSRTHMAT